MGASPTKTEGNNKNTAVMISAVAVIAAGGYLCYRLGSKPSLILR